VPSSGFHKGIKKDIIDTLLTSFLDLTLNLTLTGFAATVRFKGVTLTAAIASGKSPLSVKVVFS
jgi:hypothetical protein